MGHGDLHSVPTPSLASPTPPLQGPGGGGVLPSATYGLYSYVPL